MPSLDNNTEAFLELVRAGLWEKEARFSQLGRVDYEEVMRLAEEQSVIGLVVAGIDNINDSQIDDSSIPQEIKLQFIGETLQIEQRNQAMNIFIAELVEKLREEGICVILVKGQGVAECYEKPIWRTSGDVDLLMDAENYKKAKSFLIPHSSNRKNDERYSKHLGMSLDPWYVEIHGTLRSGLSGKVDKEIDAVQEVVHDPILQKTRLWKNGETDVMLPAPDEDVFFVFAHFIKHFYKEGLGLRQVCDWCRLLWTYRDKLDVELLTKRLYRAGLVNEWRGFAVVAVEYLGMPAETMPFYDSRFKVKGTRIIKLILKGYSGNKYKDTLRIAMIYPWSTMKFLPGILWHVNWLKLKERLL